MSRIVKPGQCLGLESTQQQILRFAQNDNPNGGAAQATEGLRKPAFLVLTFLDGGLTELDANFAATPVQTRERKSTSQIEGRMAQAAVSLTKFYWVRFRVTGSTLLLFSQKSLFTFFSVMLPVLLFLLSSGWISQADGQTISAYASSSATVEAEVPDAPSAAADATAQQSSQPDIPFLPRLSNRPQQPMDVGDKFKYFVEPAFGPRSFVTNAFGAGMRMANPPSHYPSEWHDGAEAFGRLYGDSFARTGAESIGRFSAASLLHEDPRYRRSDSTFVPARLGHAFLFTFIDRTDGGRATVAVSNFTGAAAGGFIGNAYLPPGFDNLTHAGQRSAIAFGGIAAQNVMQEFSPELGQFLKKIHLPHIPLPPVWWTGNH